MEPGEESRAIQDFLEGKPESLIEKLLVQTVRFKGWSGRFLVEDALQNARMALLNNFRQGQYRGEGLVSYVRKIAEVQCLLELRKHYRSEKYQSQWQESALEIADPKPDQLALLAEQGRVARGMKILKTLEKLCRKLLVFRFYKGLSHQEIALKLGMTETNVRVSVHRCLKKSKALSDKL